jgi:hypothetical protein
MFGVVLTLGGGLLLLLAVLHFWDTWKIARREPKVVTAAELCRTKSAKSAPAWMAYTFGQSQPTELTVTRHRLGYGGDVEARCLLVRAQDKWLVASVAPGFHGHTLVGRLLPLDSSLSKSLVQRVRKLESNPFALVPYEFHAVDGCPSDQQLRYISAGWMAFFGLGGLVLGMRLLRGGRPSVRVSAAPGAGPWTYHPLPRA